MHDVKALPGLVEENRRGVGVTRIIARATMTRTLEVEGIETMIKPRRNSGFNTRSPERRLAVKLVRGCAREENGGFRDSKRQG